MLLKCAGIFLPFFLMVQFSKPFKTSKELLSLLESRGLVIPDKTSAEKFLEYTNYYRLTGYMLPFESHGHSFLPGTTFDDIQSLYLFDRELRSLVYEGIAILEVYTRAKISACLGSMGPFAHFDKSIFYSGFHWEDWHAFLVEEVKRSKETFVCHFRSTYDEWPNLPIWVSVELMSFGSISRLYCGIKRCYQKCIASNFNLRAPVLASWLHAIAYVRNICAHHARFWNRLLSIKPMILRRDVAWSCFLQPTLQDKPFVLLTVLSELLKHIQAGTGMDIQWHSKMHRLLSNPPNVPRFEQAIGMPSRWNESSLWT